MKLDEQDILVSYDVSSLFTNVLVDETIDILVEKAFKDDWFNKEYDLNITKTDIIELLEIATKNRHFQFEGNLYEQVDGVAMGSPLGPLMANAFMCNVEGKLKNQNKMLAFYKRCVDDTRSKINVRCFICLYVLVNTEWNTPVTQLHNGTRTQRQASLSRYEDHQKWSTTRYEGLRETNRYWAFIALPKPCWGQV